MAKISIGRVRPVHEGAWASSPRTYLALDIVSHGGATWFAKINVPADVVPGTDATYWDILGEKGEKGDPGLAGDTGIQGPSGTNGLDGAEGAVGPAPEHRWSDKSLQFKTPEGTWNPYVDLSGPQGTQGVQGIQGADGPAGVDGPTGLQGAQGSQGAQGLAGPDGATGPAGAKGDTGDTGAQGPTGTTGATGSWDGSVPTFAEAYNNGWYRSNGATGWYNQTYGGGIYMADSTYVRTYGSKELYVNNHIVCTGQVYGGYSDARLKENVAVIENGLATVLSWNAIVYNPNDLAEELANYDKSKREIGLFAQQIQATTPEAVSIAPFDLDEFGKSKSGNDYLTISYERLVPVLVKAIQELHEEVVRLKRPFWKKILGAT